MNAKYKKTDRLDHNVLYTWSWNKKCGSGDSSAAGSFTFFVGSYSGKQLV